MTDRQMNASGDRWVNSSLLSSLPFSTLKAHLHSSFSCRKHIISKLQKTHVRVTWLNTTQSIPMYTHAHWVQLSFPPFFGPLQGLWTSGGFPKCLSTFLLELCSHLASSCCTRSRSYKHSIYNSQKHTGTLQMISPTPGSIHLNNHPQPSVHAQKSQPLCTHLCTESTWESKNTQSTFTHSWQVLAVCVH